MKKILKKFAISIMIVITIISTVSITGKISSVQAEERTLEGVDWQNYTTETEASFLEITGNVVGTFADGLVRSGHCDS